MYSNFESDVAFSRNTLPRNRPEINYDDDDDDDFAENGGQVWGAVTRLPRKLAPLCDTF